MPEVEDRGIQKRQVAFKVSINDVQEGDFIKQDGWEPNFVEINGNKVSRANLLGTVVMKSDENNLMIDDGSGRMQLRVFEDNLLFKDVDVGDLVNTIGRIREFGMEKYLIPEIIKKITNSLWAEVRKRELKVSQNSTVSMNNNSSGVVDKKIKTNEVKENETPVEEIAVDSDEGEDDEYDKVIKIIKEKDNGEGILVEEIFEETGISEQEEIINQLLMKGEIFEIKPGKYKVLE